MLALLAAAVVPMTGRSPNHGISFTPARLRTRRLAAVFALLAILLQAFAPMGQVWAAVAQQQGDWVFPPTCVAAIGSPTDSGGAPVSPADRPAISEPCGFCFAAGTGGALVLPASPAVVAPIPPPLRIGPLAAQPSPRPNAVPPAYPRGPPARA